MANIVVFSVDQVAHIFLRTTIMMVLFGRMCILRPPVLPEGTMNSVTSINEWLKVTQPDDRHQRVQKSTFKCFF